MGNSALLAAPRTEKTIEGASNGTVSWGSCSMQGWRRSMEDAHAAVMDIAGRGVHFFAVYDGHGGAEVAEFCGRHLHSELLSHKEFREGGDIGLACSETFIRMDQKIVGTAAMKEMLDIDEADGGDKWEPQSGCTAVAAVIWGTRVVVANAGDSRCVVCDSSGKAVPLSFDHKPEDEREQARIYAAGAVVEMGRVSSRTTSSALNLTRAIGDLDFKKNLHKGPKEQAVTAWPDINTLELGGADHEFMILACDGIWEILSNQQAVDFVRERLRRPNTGVKRSTDGAAAPRCDEHQVSVARLSEIGAEMCDHCLADDTDSDCLGTDNMTVMIVLLSASSVREGPARDGAATPDIGAESKAGSVESREEKKRRLDID